LRGGHAVWVRAVGRGWGESGSRCAYIAKQPRCIRGPLGLNLQEPRAAIKTPFGVRAHPRLAKKTIGGGTSGGQSGACNPVLEAAAAGLEPGGQVGLNYWPGAA
jgi:hypothetical protein